MTTIANFSILYQLMQNMRISMNSSSNLKVKVDIFNIHYVCMKRNSYEIFLLQIRKRISVWNKILILKVELENSDQTFLLK